MKEKYNTEKITLSIKDEIERKLERAEKQIEEGETTSAEEVFREIEEEYGI